MAGKENITIYESPCKAQPCDLSNVLVVLWVNIFLTCVVGLFVIGLTNRVCGEKQCQSPHCSCEKQCVEVKVCGEVGVCGQVCVDGCVPVTVEQKCCPCPTVDSCPKLPSKPVQKTCH